MLPAGFPKQETPDSPHSSSAFRGCLGPRSPNSILSQPIACPFGILNRSSGRILVLKGRSGDGISRLPRQELGRSLLMFLSFLVARVRASR